MKEREYAAAFTPAIAASRKIRTVATSYDAAEPYVNRPNPRTYLHGKVSMADAAHPT
jgi:hypothetical protein